jgi:hypothetical protein
MDAQLFDGGKYFVIGETSHLGGKNYYISCGFFVSTVTSLFFVIAFGFLAKKDTVTQEFLALA